MDSAVVLEVAGSPEVAEASEVVEQVEAGKSNSARGEDGSILWVIL